MKNEFKIFHFAFFSLERMQILYFSGSTPELLDHRTTFLYGMEQSP